MRTLVVVASVLSLHVAALATQKPGTDAWQHLNPASEAYVVLKKRCQGEASEEVFASVEGVLAIYVENPEAGSSITGDSGSYGITYTNPPYAYLRNGLVSIEFSSSAKHIHPSDKNADQLPYARFDTKTRNTSFISKLTAPVVVRYSKTTSTAEEAVGVHGRLIEVVERSTGKLLARRRDFVWINPDQRGAHGGFMCPTPKVGEAVPISFIGRAVNPKSYTCWSDRTAALSSLPNWRSVAPGLTSRLNECEAGYFRRVMPSR